MQHSAAKAGNMYIYDESVEPAFYETFIKGSLGSAPHYSGAWLTVHDTQYDCLN